MGVPEFNQINQQENQVDDQARKQHQVISIPSNTKPPTNINCNMATIKQFLDATHSKPHHNLTDEQLRQLGLHLPIGPATTAHAAYPTENRIRQKEKEAKLKEEGKEIVRKKKPVHIEFGDDDMGECTDSIVEYVEAPLAYFDFGMHRDAWQEPDWWLGDAEEEFLLNMEADMHPIYWMYGSEVAEAARSPETLRYGNMLAFLHYWRHDRDDDQFVDVVEICGGAGRVSTMLIRRWHTVRTGKNFDVIVGIDLLNQMQKDAMWTYFNRTQPLTALLATPCTGLAGFKGINAFRGSETHFRNRTTSIALGTLGG